MKQIIELKVKANKADLAKCKTDLLVLGVFSDAKTIEKGVAEIDKRLDGAISKLNKLSDFTGKNGTNAVLYGNEKIGAKRVLLIGLGEKKKIKLENIRNAAALAANKAVAMKAHKVSMSLHGCFDGFDILQVAQTLTEGIYFGGYRYDEYVTGKENGRMADLDVELIDSAGSIVKKLAEGVKTGSILGQAQNFSRTIANRPGNVINPPKLGDIARELAAKTKGLKCTVFDERKLKTLGMGGILAIGKGSNSPPRFIVLKYSPAKKAKNLPRTALVGKAITFDTGGISIKPSANMEQMKFDKSGGLAVLGAMKAIAELQLPIEVYGLIPSAENMPSGTSCRPGDIVKTYSGKTVEIQNTDAEGRMILCDVLAWATENKCELIVDIATLTGACMVALGQYMAGLFSNDDQLVKNIQKAAEDSGEKVWHLPCGEDYAKEMKSKIADLKNIGGKWGGACTAAAFLRQFIGETKWAHIDMAGVDLFERSTEIAAEGSSGYGVRLLTAFVANLTKK